MAMMLKDYAKITPRACKKLGALIEGRIEEIGDRQILLEKRKKRFSRGLKRFLRKRWDLVGGSHCFGRIDIHPAAGAVETNLAIDECPDRVIAAQADILAGEELRAALADDDIAGDDDLAAELFHAEAFADAIAPVFDGTLTFFMSHKLMESWEVKLK